MTPQNRLARSLKRFIFSRTGNVAMIFAFAAPIIALLVAASMEIGNGVTVRRALQDALDSAVLAASRSGAMTDDDLTAAAQAFIEANRGRILGEHPIRLTVTRDGETGDMTVLGAAEIDLPTMFANVVGRDSTEITVNSQVRALQDPQLQLALVLDTTGSMSGSKINTLRSAASNLVNYIMDRVDAPIGVVPFAQYVNVGVDSADETGVAPPMVTTGRGRRRTTVVDPTWQGCVGSPPSPYNRQDNPASPMPGLTDVSCPTQLLRLTRNRATLLNNISDLNASGWTYIPSGLMWGWRVLSEAEPFADSQNFLEEDDEVQRVMVLMTDGANTRFQTDNTEYHNSSSQSGADALTAQICDAIKADGVRVFTVAFEVTDTATRNMLRACATEPSMYFDAGSAAALNAAFDAIARDVVALYIAQ